MRTRKYYFARVNIWGEFGGEDRHAALLRALRSTTAEVASARYVWGFFDVVTFQYQRAEFVEGHLVKLMPETEEEIADLDDHSLRRQSIENRTKAKVRFFLHRNSGLVAHHVAGNDITASQFRTFFERVVVEALGGFFVDVSVEAVKDDVEFLERIRRFARIDKLRFELHPTNPRYRAEYRPVGERLERLGAQTYKEEYISSEEGGLDIRDDEEIEGRVLMATDGYGRGSVTGELDGEERTISTGENPIAVSAPSKAEEPEAILRRLYDMFQKIRKRVGR